MYAGCLYVADWLNNRVQVLTLNGGFLRCFAVGYPPGHIALRSDARLLVETDGRVEMMTLFGSLRQVPPRTYTRCTHCTRHIADIGLKGELPNRSLLLKF